LNITTDLRDFQWIVPCGIADREVTSLEREVPDGVTVPTLEQGADAAARCFGQVFSEQVLAVESLEVLRAGAQTRIGEEIEQLGVPMRVPEELERLGGKAEKPVRA